MLQLKLLGIAADSAANGVDALAAWAPGRYAAVLADIHMPRMDGHELARRLRATEAERGATRTPIVAVTANAMKGEEERASHAGMDAYLVEAGEHRAAARDAGTLAADPGREQWPTTTEDRSERRHCNRPRRACSLARRRPAPPLDRCWGNSVKRRSRPNGKSTLPRAPATLRNWPRPHTSSVAPRKPSVRPALAPPLPRWSRRARRATAHTAVTCSARSRCKCVTHLWRSRGHSGSTCPSRAGE